MAKPQITSLPLWDNKVKSLRKTFEEQLTLAEIMTHARSTMDPLITEPTVKTADHQVRETLISLAAHYEEHGCPFVVVMNNADQTEALLLNILSVRKRENEEPVIQLNWCKHTRTHPDMPKAIKLIMEAGQREQMVTVKPTQEELDLLSKILKENETKKRDYTLPKSQIDFMSSSYLSVVYKPETVNDKKAAKAQRTCVVCGEAGPLRCSRCASVQYCSATCQRQHWKSGHKKICNTPIAEGAKPEASSLGVSDDGESVYIESQITDNRFKGQSATMVSTLTGAMNSFNINDKVPYNLHGDDDFLVKIQIPMGGGIGTMMMYDQKRSFSRMITPSEPGAMKIHSAVAQYGVGKLYFKARREGTKFRVFLKPLPSQRQPW